MSDAVGAPPLNTSSSKSPLWRASHTTASHCFFACSTRSDARWAEAAPDFRMLYWSAWWND